MGVMPVFMSMSATNMAYGSTAAMFGAQEQIAGLASGVTGNSNVDNPVRLAEMETALKFQGIMAQSNYLASQSMQAGAQGLLKKNQELRERLGKAGATLF